MYAELRIRTDKDLPVDLGVALERRFTATADKIAVIDATVLRGVIEEDEVIFASRNSSRVFLVKNLEARFFEVHLEKSLKKDDLKGLQQRIEQVIKSMEEFLRL